MSRTDDQLLRELMREAELVLSQQLHTMDELDDKSEQLLAQGIGAIGAGIALFAFVAGKAPSGSSMPFVVAWAFGLALNAGGVFAFLVAYIGGRVAPSVGLSLAWIAGKARDDNWTMTDHLVSVLQAYPEYFASNEGIVRGGARARRAGLSLVLTSAIAYAAAAIYLLGGGMGWT